MTALSADVTVLIPVRNGARFVDEAIASVLEQDLENLCLLVSDNQSADATAAILERRSRDPRLSVVRQPEYLSRVRHFNNCLARVATDYYMLLCHDDYLASHDALRAAREVLVREPTVNAVYCDLQYVDAQRRPIALRGFKRSGRFDARSTARESILTGRNLFGIPLLVRTSAVRGLNYDEALPYAGDVDLALESAAGGALYHLPRALIANRYHAHNATWEDLNGVSSEMRLIARKHGISLSSGDRVRAAFNTWLTALTKILFRAYILVRR